MFNFGFKRRNNNGPPKQALLFRAKAPNSDNVLNEESTASLETLLDAGYSLPTSVFAAVGVGPWFSLDGETPVPITRLMSDILLDTTINQYHILASLRGGVAVYDPYTVWDSTIAKADRYFKATAYSSTPTAYFNGVSIAGSTSFDSGGLGTNPGQWVLAHQGLPGDPMTLVNAGVDVPAIEGARLEWVPSGVELITNAADRELSSDTGWWIKETAGITISGGRCIFTNTTGALYKTGILTIGKRYLVSYRINSLSSGGFRLKSGATYSPTRTSLTTHVETLIPAGAELQFIADVATTGSIDDLSIQELLPTWRDTYLDGTPICPTTSQLTRTFDAGFTTAVAGATYAAYDRSANPLLMPGFKSESARTNKVTCRKANPVDTSGLTYIVGGSGTIVNDSVALSTSPFYLLASSGSVYEITLPAGAAVFFPGTCANLNSHSGSIAARLISGPGIMACIEASGTAVDNVLSATYSRVEVHNITPSTTGRRLLLYNNNATTAVVRCILPQLEEGPFCTSPICKLQDGTDPLTALTRAGTVSSWPCIGKIRSNNQGSIGSIVPRATGQSGVCVYSTYTDASNYTAIILGPTVITYRKRIAGVNTDATVSITHTKDVPLQFAWGGHSGVGMQIAARQYTGGAWSAWTNGTLINSAAGKANAVVGTLYQYGSLNGISQFVGNISLIENIDIPGGITDVIAWIKSQMGVA